MVPPDPIDHVGRKHPASGVRIDLEQPTIVFLTVNTRDRVPWLTQPLVHQLLRETWNSAHAWLVGYYVLMPDHLHLFCAPQDLNVALNTWVTYWKSQFKKNLHQQLVDPGKARLSTNPHQIVRTVPAEEGRQPGTGEEWTPQEGHPARGKVRVRQEPLPPLVGDPATYRWQEGNPWDTRLRRSESYAEKWQYVRENPLRKGLVKNLDEWPYQGMLHVLQW